MSASMPKPWRTPKDQVSQNALLSDCKASKAQLITKSANAQGTANQTASASLVINKQKKEMFVSLTLHIASEFEPLIQMWKNMAKKIKACTSIKDNVEYTYQEYDSEINYDENTTAKTGSTTEFVFRVQIKRPQILLGHIFGFFILAFEKSANTNDKKSNSCVHECMIPKQWQMGTNCKEIKYSWCPLFDNYQWNLVNSSYDSMGSLAQSLTRFVQYDKTYTIEVGYISGRPTLASTNNSPYSIEPITRPLKFAYQSFQLKDHPNVSNNAPERYLAGAPEKCTEKDARRTFPMTDNCECGKFRICIMCGVASFDSFLGIKRLHYPTPASTMNIWNDKVYKALNDNCNAFLGYIHEFAPNDQLKNQWKKSWPNKINLHTILAYLSFSKSLKEKACTESPFYVAHRELWNDIETLGVSVQMQMRDSIVKYLSLSL